MLCESLPLASGTRTTTYTTKNPSRIRTYNHPPRCDNIIRDVKRNTISNDALHAYYIFRCRLTVNIWIVSVVADCWVEIDFWLYVCFVGSLTGRNCWSETEYFWVGFWGSGLSRVVEYMTARLATQLIICIVSERGRLDFGWLYGWCRLEISQAGWGLGWL